MAPGPQTGVADQSEANRIGEDMGGGSRGLQHPLAQRRPRPQGPLQTQTSGAVRTPSLKARHHTLVTGTQKPVEVIGEQTDGGGERVGGEQAQNQVSQERTRETRSTARTVERHG